MVGWRRQMKKLDSRTMGWLEVHHNLPPVLPFCMYGVVYVYELVLHCTMYIRCFTHLGADAEPQDLLHKQAPNSQRHRP